MPRSISMAVMALALSACAAPAATPATADRPAPPPTSASATESLGGGVHYRCHEGRAIYTFKIGYAGGIAVIPNAPECPVAPGGE